MKLIFTLIVSLLSLTAFCQDLTGIWRGSFVSADNKMSDLFNLEDRYKYEVQIDQRGKSFDGVTYSYKKTEFYGKASSNGTINLKTGKVMLQELKLLELKMASSSYACWMICFMQYTKNGDEEFLEGKYSSYRESDSSFCGKGNVFLRRVVTSDFYKEPFLVKHEQEKKDAIAKNNLPPAAVKNKTATINTIKPVIPNTRQNTIAKKPPVIHQPLANTSSVKKVPNNKKTSPPVAKASELPAKDIKGVPLGTEELTPDKKIGDIKMKSPTFIPPVLRNRENEIVQSVTVNTNEVTLNIYDNGTIDHDTISVYLDKKLVISHQMLTTNPIVLKLKMDENTDYHELVMVADNLGDIPPNTSLMIVKAGDKQYEVRIASTEQKNAVVIFKYEKAK